MGLRLLNCPFCGGRAEVKGKEGKWVVCVDCFSENSYYKTEEEAIAAWNRRYEPTGEVDFDYAAEDGNG